MTTDMSFAKMTDDTRGI